MLRRFRVVGSLTTVAFATLLVIGLVGDASAQAQPARIRGTVIDSETGDRLDYANVVIKGTSRGTMSLGGGSFSFNGLAPGTYTIQVLYLGYEPAEQTVTVAGGDSKDVEFRLKVTIVEQLPEYAVEGASYMVETTSVTSKSQISSEKFEQYAIDSVDQALARQAGVVMRAGQLYVRGGRSGEVQSQIDGVSVDNPIGGGSLEVSTLAVENVQMVTGGLDAEYGNALSGVINTTTKTGSREKFEGGIRFLTDDFGRQDRTFTNLDRFEYGFGGPTPVKGLTYYVSGNMVFTDGENYSIANRPEYQLNLGDVNLATFRRRQSNTALGSAKLAYYFDDQSRKVLTAEYSYSLSRNEGYSPNWSVSGYVRKIVYMPLLQRITQAGEYGDTYQYMDRPVPVYYGPWLETMLQRARPAVVLDQRNSSMIRQVVPIIEVRSAADNSVYTVAAQPTFEGYSYPYSSFSTAQEDSSYIAFNAADSDRTAKSLNQVYKLVWRHNVNDETFYEAKVALVSFDSHTNVDGKDPFEYNHGGIASPDLFSGRYLLYSSAGDYYTDQFNPLYVTSSDYPLWDEQYSRTYSGRIDVTSQRWEGHMVKTGLLLVYNDLEQQTLISPAIESANRYTGLYSLGANRNRFHTYNPEASWYVQDRWSHEGLVMNYGFRWDMFSPGSAANIILQNDDVDRNVLKYKTAFSPRLGFAFPITDRDGFSFYYGRFVQFPARQNLFASQEVVGNTGTLGNPNLDAESTISYQAAIQHQFTDYLAGTFAIWSKDIYDLISATQVTDVSTGNTIARYINKAYASARGIEMTLNKRISNKYAFDIAYTFMYADGVASDSEFGGSPEGLQFLPSQELPLDWDQRHSINVDFRLEEANAWDGSVSIAYGSGYPWTPFDRFAKKQNPLLENSERLPSTFGVTMQFRRFINFYGQRFTLELQGWNLLNQDNPESIGAGIYPGLNNAAAAYVPYLTETGKFGGALLQDQNGDTFNEFIPIHDPRVFAQHRTFRLGLGWRF